MPPLIRTRSKDVVTLGAEVVDMHTGTTIWRYSQPYATDYLTDSAVRHNSLRRTKYSTNSGIDISSDERYFTIWTNLLGLSTDPSSTYSFIEPFLNRLNVRKIPTHNQADLLTNLAEFDDTLLMFSKNLGKSVSYGGYKWGWAPLVGDIMAVNDAANAVKKSTLIGSTRSSRYVTVDKFTVKSVPFPSPHGTVQHTWEVRVKYSGDISVENDILAFYDYMGFHPSPKLLWDLVPMSFAIDYILPIGDMLSNLTPARGWTKSANFTGWRVIKATVTEKLLVVRSDYKSIAARPPIEFTLRDYLSGVAFHQKLVPKLIEPIKWPSLEQAFDIGYLANTLLSGPKNQKSPKVKRIVKPPFKWWNRDVPFL